MQTRAFHTILLAVAAFAGTPGIAAAQNEGLTFDQQATYCDNTGLAYHADLQIGGCSALMQVEDRSRVNIGTTFIRRGQAYARQGEHEAAIADFTAAVALDPRAAAAYYGRAQSRRETRAYAGAVADLDQVIRLRPGNAGDLNSRCWARAVGNLQLEQALADCNASLAIEAGNRATLDSRGLVKLRMGDARGALADFTAAYDNTAARAHSLYGRGLAKIELGRSAEGEADIAAAMAADDSVSAAYASYGLRGIAAVETSDDVFLRNTLAEGALLSSNDQFAWCINAQGTFNRAQVIAGCTLVLRSGRVQAAGVGPAFVTRGVVYNDLGRPQQALADLDQALKLDPSSSYALRNRALTRSNAGMLDEALADASEAMRLEPTSVFSFATRATVYMDRGQYPQAVADWDEVIRQQPDNADHHFNRGLALEEMESYSRAIADYDRANALVPNNPTILNGRCWARALWGRQLDQALADCEAALRIEDEPYIIDSRAMVKLGLGDAAGAYEDFNAAYTRDSSLATSLYGRGVAQIRLGRTVEGRADIAAALALDPEAAANYVLAGQTP